MKVDLAKYRSRLEETASASFRGRITKVVGILVEASGFPATLGELCRIEKSEGGEILLAEVVGFRGDAALLMPYGDMTGIGVGAPATSLGRRFVVRVGVGLLGRVLDGFGHPIDEGEPFPVEAEIPVHREAPNPLHRVPITEPIETGVRAIDGLITLGRGQRIGIFSGSGIGKSTLLAQVAKGAAADVAVIALIGERGREVQGFIREALGPEGLQRAVVVAATSDRPPIERFKGAFVATAIAEFFRDRGKNVLFVMDSVTRFAAACREIGLALGEPPTLKGYPPSFFATVPKLVERLGRTRSGSITGFYTVLIDADDMDDPVGDTLRGLLDGHIILSRSMANRNHFPSIDVLASLSRLMTAVASSGHKAAAGRFRDLLTTFEENRDLVQIGAYRPGTNPKLDAALVRIQGMEAFLRQTPEHRTALAETTALLGKLTEGYQG